MESLKNAKNNTTLKLSRSRFDYDDIRDLGNFASHKLEYNTKRKDIDDIRIRYRACIEELLYKSGLKK
jgi:hypothetical protein